MKNNYFYFLLVLSCIVYINGEKNKYGYYETLFLSTPLDHFSFSNNDTFQLRYLINDTFWKPGGPIFFYTGNEGDIELFAQNTGFMWDIAPHFEAMLIFAEHRYYGKTMPYGDKSYSDAKHLGYLTSTQALADYVYLLNFIQNTKKENEHHKNRIQVIAFGGSYGGMLAAWMRLKYPYVIDAALASSAPVYQFQGLTPCNTFSNVVAKVFKASSRSGLCAKNIKKSWKTIRNITSSVEGKSWLSTEWKLCKPLINSEDVTNLIDEIVDTYGNVAMINYPYPTEFLAPVPAHPVRAMCNKIDEQDLDGKQLLKALGNALSIYTNYTGTTKCLNFSQSAIGEDGWEFQACTEIVMPMCTDYDNELFEPVHWNFTEYSKKCTKKFGTHVTRDDYAVLEYGGKTAEYTNVIFTNGLLDPWCPGGSLKTNSAYAILIPDAAHHLDLRGANAADPVSVIVTRDHIKNIIQSWIKAFK